MEPGALAESLQPTGASIRGIKCLPIIQNDKDEL